MGGDLDSQADARLGRVAFLCRSLAVSLLLGLVVWVPCCRVQAQTDAAASVYGAFNSSTSGNGTTQRPSNAAGVLLELRHIWNPLAGVEASYSYHRANQAYASSFYPPCAVDAILPCGLTSLTAAVPADAHVAGGVGWCGAIFLWRGAGSAGVDAAAGEGAGRGAGGGWHQPAVGELMAASRTRSASSFSRTLATSDSVAFLPMGTVMVMVLPWSGRGVTRR